MRLKMTKIAKNPNITVGHFICQSAALYGEMQFLLLQEYRKNSAKLRIRRQRQATSIGRSSSGDHCDIIIMEGRNRYYLKLLLGKCTVRGKSGIKLKLLTSRT